MNNDTFTQLKHQLEYFYLIPVDQIVDKIRNHSNIKNGTSLNTIFEYVYKGASHYYDFIVANINHTFFNENYGEPLRVGLCQLLYLSMQNNCILNAYFDKLALASEPLELSGKNVPLIKNLITNLITGNKKPLRLRGEVDSQFFNNRKGIYKNDLIQNIYTNAIIDALNISENKDEIYPIYILQYILPAANFLFMTDACSKFGRSLASKMKILEKYKNLWKKYTEVQQDYSLSIDKLIFQAEMESIFGFHFFASIYSNLKSIHQMEVSEFKCLKDLEGQLFNDIILQIANLPVFYGKSLFFRYICYAFTNSSNIDFSYFEESANSIATSLSPPLPKAQQVINGLNLMNKFFKILSSVSLPVLFSLWKVVIHELELKNFFTENINDIYTKYLEDNLDMLTYDYDRLSDENICKLYAKRLRQNALFDNTFLRSNIITTDIAVDNDQQNFFSCSASSYLYENMQNLLYAYCNLDSLKNFRCASFFLTRDELSTYSPLSHLITSLQYIPEGYDTHDTYRKKSFLMNFRDSLLFEYILSQE